MEVLNKINESKDVVAKVKSRTKNESISANIMLYWFFEPSCVICNWFHA